MTAAAPTDAEFTTALRTGQVIAAALTLGVIVFGAVSLLIRGDDPPQAWTVSAVAAGAAVPAVVARQFFVAAYSGRAAGGESAAADLARFQTRLIVGLAILEGAAFFNLVAYLVEGHWWSYIPVGALLGLMLLAYPTAGKLRRWIDDRAQLREFGPDPA